MPIVGEPSSSLIEINWFCSEYYAGTDHVQTPPEIIRTRAQNALIVLVPFVALTVTSTIESIAKVIRRRRWLKDLPTAVINIIAIVSPLVAAIQQLSDTPATCVATCGGGNATCSDQCQTSDVGAVVGFGLLGLSTLVETKRVYDMLWLLLLHTLRLLKWKKYLVPVLGAIPLVDTFAHIHYYTLQLSGQGNPEVALILLMVAMLQRLLVLAFLYYRGRTGAAALGAVAGVNAIAHLYPVMIGGFCSSSTPLLYNQLGAVQTVLAVTLMGISNLTFANAGRILSFATPISPSGAANIASALFLNTPVFYGIGTTAKVLDDQAQRVVQHAVAKAQLVSGEVEYLFGCKNLPRIKRRSEWLLCWLCRIIPTVPLLSPLLILW